MVKDKNAERQHKFLCRCGRKRWRGEESEEGWDRGKSTCREEERERRLKQREEKAGVLI